MYSSPVPGVEHKVGTIISYNYGFTNMVPLYMCLIINCGYFAIRLAYEVCTVHKRVWLVLNLI